MIMPDKRYTMDFTISSFDVDARGMASLQSISRYMQEIATMHAKELKLGFHDMMKENRAWVLAQMLIRIDRFPPIHESFSITSWSNGPDGRFALRDFEITDKDNNIIGAASSTWFVVDVSTKRICRLDNYFEGYQYDNKVQVMGRNPARIKPFEESETEHDFEVRYSDLDINGHLNNVRYIDFILDMFTDQFRMDHEINELEMNFLKESRSGDQLSGRMMQGKGENEYLHTLLNTTAGRPSFTARTKWI